MSRLLLDLLPFAPLVLGVCLVVWMWYLMNKDLKQYRQLLKYYERKKKTKL